MIISFPLTIQKYLKSIDKISSDAGYLYISKNLTLQNYGGELDEFGMKNLIINKNIMNSLPILEGMFPIKEDFLMIPFIKIENNKSFDIHIINDIMGYWIVFIDASMDEMKKKIFHQKVNEDCLLNRDKSKTL